MRRYGKPSGPLLALKHAFFENDGALKREALDHAALYADQIRRACCKCCDEAIGTAQFTKQGVGYTLCARCGHLNGVNEDTDAFCGALYTEDEGRQYARSYATEDRAAYEQRTNDIYRPKAAFLKDALAGLGEPPAGLSYADLGAGSGYFVAALRAEGLERSTGYEVSGSQVALAAAMNGAGLVRRHDLAETARIAGAVESEVVSMIGVLEHLQRPREVLAALRGNGAVRYLYISVPLFSPSVFFEMAFPAVMHRQLSGGHTHLYTEDSLAWTAREFAMTRAAEWWFGTDMVDLLRSIDVTLRDNPETAAMAEAWSQLMSPALDDMQMALDKRHMSSEVHVLFRFEQ